MFAPKNNIQVSNNMYYFGDSAFKTITNKNVMLYLTKIYIRRFMAIVIMVIEAVSTKKNFCVLNPNTKTSA